MSGGHGRKATSEEMSRRRFLRSAVIGGGAVVIAAGALGLGRMLLSGDDRRPKIGVVTVPATLVPEVGAEPHRDESGAFFLINNEDGALALSWICTHQGCRVPWNADERRFRCPCHAALYDRHGAVTGGPAPRPLDLLPLSFDADGNAKVDTDRVIERDTYDPSQAVPVTT